MNSIKLFDIDGTLINTHTQIYVDGVAYPQSEYKRLCKEGKKIDLSEFDNKEKVKQDLTNGEKLPLFKLLQGYGPLIKKAFITARSQESAIERWFLKNNILGHFYAVNDPESRASCYGGMEDWEKWDTAQRKAKIIEYYCKKYDLVEFFDDELDNLTEAKKLNMKNLVLWLVKGENITLFV